MYYVKYDEHVEEMFKVLSCLKY